GLPAYEGTHLLDLLIATVVGVVVALLLAAVRFAATRVSGLQHMRFGMGVLLVAGGLAVGLLAQLAVQLGADAQLVLFSGQTAVPELVGETSTTIVVVLLVAKGLGYAVSLGCGFRGGPVFPAIFLGVAIAMLAVLWFDTSPTLAVAVGTAAGMAAATRLLFASLLFAALLAGSQGVDTMPAAVLAAVAAWTTTTALTRRSSRAEEEADPDTA
ncbi:MAG TPA: chloride channel protein, partial [Jiangellaceae bacterium]|nr:chloride channel protein [Jiangellaceae bacterium]